MSKHAINYCKWITYESQSSFWPLAGIIFMLMVIVVGGRSSNYNFTLDDYNYYHVGKLYLPVFCKIIIAGIAESDNRQPLRKL